MDHGEAEYGEAGGEENGKEEIGGETRTDRPRGDKRFIRRDPAGRIKESDDVSRSLSQDRHRNAKKAAKPGQGDRDDRKAPARKASRAKR
jgi:hypothetical protein